MDTVYQQMLRKKQIWVSKTKPILVKEMYFQRNDPRHQVGLDVWKPVFGICKQQKRRPSIIFKLATSEISTF